MPEIRILVVDDAVVVRQLLSKILSSDPLLAVVGVAANGRIALAKIPQVNPDLIVLDLEMPEMDGLETLAAIRQRYPRLPVIVFSAVTERGAVATLEALALGATDYATKPASTSKDEAIAYVRQQLLPKIKGLCGWGTTPISRLGSLPGRKQDPQRLAAPARPLHSLQPVEIVAIGVSTGGPNALAALLPALSADFPVPIVIVQHMPPLFTRRLAERLAVQCQIQIAEGQPDSILKPGQAWIAPGDFHMVVCRQSTQVCIQTHQDPPENSCRPAVDVLFRSVVEVYGAGTLAVVLTGMGQDGLHGCRCIREAGGQVLVQDEASSVVWGMPGAIAQAQLADRILPLNQLAAEIVRRIAVSKKAGG